MRTRDSRTPLFETIQQKRAFIRARYGTFLAGRVRRHRRKLSICADCGYIFTPTERHATNVLCAQCNLDDQEWDPVDERRIAKRKQRDAYLATEHAILISAGERLAESPTSNSS